MDHNTPHQRLLVTDLDGTLIGDDDAMVRLWNLLRERDIPVVFCTGRHLQSTLEVVQTHDLQPGPLACICMVGTEIHLLKDGTYECDLQWRDHISKDWNRSVVEQIAESIPDLVAQDALWQSPLKCSYYLETNVDQCLAEIHQRLEAKGSPAKIVYSGGKYLDILPSNAGKGAAIDYLVQSLGIDRGNVITCGDSGNDLDMMRAELGFRCIIVANASPELKQLTAPHLYQATKPNALGIEEGLRRVGWIC